MSRIGRQRISSDELGFGATATLTPVNSGLENILEDAISVTITVNQATTAYRIFTETSWGPSHVPLATKLAATAVIVFDAPCPPGGGQAWWTIV